MTDPIVGSEVRKALRTQRLFRDVNEEIGAINEAFSVVSETFDIVCECGRNDCTRIVTVPVDEYRRARGESDVFLVAPGHERRQLERVVSAGAEHTVVALLPGLAAARAGRGEPG